MSPSTTRGADGAPLPATRGGGRRARYAEATRALLQETLFDAASALLSEHPWSAVRMVDIARAAGVSRQTLYNEFGSRQSFAQAYIIHEAEKFLAAVRDAIHTHRDRPRAAVSAAVEVFLTAAASEPLIAAIVAGDESDGLLPLVTNQAGPVLSFATDNVTAYLATIWPGVASRSLRQVAEQLVRLAISHAASPTAAPAEVGATLAEVLGPHLDELVTGSEQ
ncbi:TetR/AcrR family transcriptional regulator [Haloechinothrix alba]|uniref:TetR/AcrR family transcriptional regulator n=1 Tax=Haloechinothrix alba TaxID=664784 RepID=UPI001C3D18B9|nr:TetR/AcrR family transcriptional regulator [Haloechinothrix alba]